MNKIDKELATISIEEEKKHLKWLEETYRKAAQDCADKIADLQKRKGFEPENLQTIIYQQKYQKAIQSQINGTLNKLHTNVYEGVTDYLNRCYEDGYIGTMYNFNSQGIPIITPIDQKQVVNAIQHDSKISKGMYSRLGEDVNKLKMGIKAEVSRGIVNGSSWNDVANRLVRHMTNTPVERAKNNAIRIARTEGHRVQNEAQWDACQSAKEKGSDVVKIWDASLDGRTRESHLMVNGEVRELDEEFSNGLMYPSDPMGDASEVINCRCRLSQKARWLLSDGELSNLREQAKEYGLDKVKSYEAFKDKYLEVSEDIITKHIQLEDVDIAIKGTTIKSEVSSEIKNALEKYNSKYKFDDVVAIKDDASIIFNTRTKDVGTWCHNTLEINENALGGKTVKEINEVFSESAFTVCNSLEDGVVHEIYHAKLASDLHYSEYKRLCDEEGIVGISSTASKDSSEAIAEMGVLKERGEFDTIPQEGKDLFLEHFKE